MKVYLYSILSILFFGCQTENSYQFDGKFLNGTTNKPYKNVVVDFTETIGPKGQRDFNFLGSAKTDSNGCFSFKYTIEENPASKLWLDFGDNGFFSLYQKNEIPIDQNNNMVFYLSDSNTTEFVLNTNMHLGEKDKLRIYIYGSDFDTVLNYNDLFQNKPLRIRTSIFYSYVGFQRIYTDSIFTSFPLPVTIEGDPIINKIIINY